MAPHTTSYEQHRNRINQLADLFSSILKLETECLYRSGMIDPAMYSQHGTELAVILLRSAIERVKNSGPLKHYTTGMQDAARNLENA